jgi:hypothetical protein
LDLLALVIFNLIFGVILYYIISVKVTSSVQDYQLTKLKKEIQNHTITFFKESEDYLALMDSRIKILKNLIQKAESLGIDFHAEEIEKLQTKNNPKPEKPIISKELPKETLISNTKDESQKQIETIHKTIETIDLTKKEDTGIIGGIGKVIKSIMGFEDPPNIENVNFPTSPNITSKSVIQSPAVQKKPQIDYSIGGNPFEENKISQKKSISEFEALVNPINKYNIPKDKLKISIKASLSEYPESAPKVEKVVHLLKKGFSHSEISEELGLAIPEISLIETIKLEKNRRK